jgi:hypothetical protein
MLLCHVQPVKDTMTEWIAQPDKDTMTEWNVQPGSKGTMTEWNAQPVKGTMTVCCDFMPNQLRVL